MFCGIGQRPWATGLLRTSQRGTEACSSTIVNAIGPLLPRLQGSPSIQTMTHHTPAATRVDRIALIAVVCVCGLLSIVCFFLGGEFSVQAISGLVFAPFVAIAILAHHGQELPWARVLSWLGSGLVLLLVFLISVGFLFGSDPENPSDHFAVGVGMLILAALASTPLLVPSFRIRFAKVLGLQLNTPAQHLGLFFTIALGLLLLAPLLGTGQVLLFTVMLEDQASAEPQALAELIWLVWQVLAAFILVGFGITRGFEQSWQRLGLNKYGAPGLLAGVGTAVALALVVLYGGDSLSDFLADFGVPVLAEEQLDFLFNIAVMTPISVVAISLTAGVGEELVYRGALQPRVGILPANLLFTAGHAWQYSLDNILIVFVVGLCLALLRRRFGIWACITAHFVYDLILFMQAIN